MQNNYSCFDICGTLYDSNTTNDFIYYISKKNIINELMFKSKFVMLANLIFAKMTGRNPLRKFYYNKLTGFTRTELLKLAESFYIDWLKGREIIHTHDMLKKYQTMDIPVILASATIEPVCKIIAKNLGVEHYISSQLKYDDHKKCVGELELDLAGLKDIFLPKGVALHSVVTDNFTDIALIKKCQSAHVITSISKQSKWNSLLKHYSGKVTFYTK